MAGPDKALLPPADDEEVSALTDAEIRVVPASDAPDELAEAVREREETAAMLALQRHTDRVRAKLVQLARTHGKVVDSGVLIALPLTHDLIAEMTASARETVTLALRELRTERFVTRIGRAYVVRVSPADL